MNQLSRSVQKSTWNLFPYLGDLLRVLGSGARRFTATASIYLVEHRRARDTEEFYERLSHTSDAELAKRGVDRGGIATLVKERLP